MRRLSLRAGIYRNRRGGARDCAGRTFQQRPTIEGIVKEVFTKKPWQMVNPVAPVQYGSGRKMVSKDFGPGTPYHSSGLIVASVES